MKWYLNTFQKDGPLKKSFNFFFCKFRRMIKAKFFVCFDYASQRRQPWKMM